MRLPANHAIASSKMGTCEIQLLLNDGPVIVFAKIASMSLPRTKTTSERPETLASQERETGERCAAVITSVRQMIERSSSTVRQMPEIAMCWLPPHSIEVPIHMRGVRSPSGVAGGLSSGPQLVERRRSPATGRYRTCKHTLSTNNWTCRGVLARRSAINDNQAILISYRSVEHTDAAEQPKQKLGLWHLINELHENDKVPQDEEGHP